MQGHAAGGRARRGLYPRRSVAGLDGRPAPSALFSPAAMNLRHLPLWLAPLLLCGLDFSLTLLGQPEGFWDPAVRRVNEGSPEFKRALLAGPLAATGLAAFWMLSLAGLLVLLPRWFAVWLATAAAVGHTWGASTWLWQIPVANSYVRVMLLCVGAAGLMTLGLAWFLHATSGGPTRRISPWLRWILVAALAGWPVLAFLVPH